MWRNIGSISLVLFIGCLVITNAQKEEYKQSSLLKGIDQVQLAMELKLLERYFKKLGEYSKKYGVGDYTIECGVCGIVINEIEGFIVENLTESEIITQLDQDVCSFMTGDLEAICDQLVADVPNILNGIEQGDQVGVVCVNLGYCVKPFSPHTDPQPIPQYTINLDLPPAQRWTQICSNAEFQNVSQWLVNTIDALLPGKGSLIEDLGKAINVGYLPADLAQEIQGCASAVGVSYGWLTMLNLGYEVSDACTSIVAQTTSGKIYHARNLDFWDGMGFTSSLKDLAFQATFTSGGKQVFQATTFSGFVGVLSGMKPNAFSLTIDTRFYPQGFYELFYEVIAAITERNASLVTFLSREVMMNENNFGAAIENLSFGELIADVYYIVAGVSAGQGAVISRNRQNATDVWMLDSPTRWFEVQTNYDHWEQPPWFDNRVTPANDAMEKMGQNNLTLQGMFDVLSVKPVFNLQTTYTILACPADGTLQSWTRYCDYPCVE